MPREKTFDIDTALDSAMKLFWVKGYAATSMQSLLDQMGINRGSFYDTYGDKRRLFLAALRRYDQRYRRERLESLAAQNSPLKTIEALFDGWVRSILADPDRGGCFITNTALELAAHDTEIGGLVADSQKDTEKFLTALLRKAKANGEIAGHVHAKRSARSLLAALFGLLVLARSRPERALLKSIARTALDSLH